MNSERQNDQENEYLFSSLLNGFSPVCFMSVLFSLYGINAVDYESLKQAKSKEGKHAGNHYFQRIVQSW